jgi:hypothetical protein
MKTSGIAAALPAQDLLGDRSARSVRESIAKESPVSPLDSLRLGQLIEDIRVLRRIAFPAALPVAVDLPVRTR